MNFLTINTVPSKDKTAELQDSDVFVKNTFVLCFDGTGNEFKGNATDSNILKVYRLLDHSLRNQYAWYNPGIGTYIQTNSLTHRGPLSRLKSKYAKVKDEAFGASLGDHVMAGYAFLMRYYSPGDDIYIFGFSRGAYTARFLSQMLDHIGLLSAGNENLQRFAWKCFSKWESRLGGDTDQAKAKTQDIYEYMKAFRETFCRPVDPIKFLGLFDTVNSVPRFESAWMKRTKFPYTARSSAKVIRHAVSINERRAKFRVDLVSGSKAQDQAPEEDKPKFHRYLSDLPAYLKPSEKDEKKSRNPLKKLKVPTMPPPPPTIEIDTTAEAQPATEEASAALPPLTKANSHNIETSSSQPVPRKARSLEYLHVDISEHQRSKLKRRSSDLHHKQDISEVWFAGNHGDIGGGWDKHSSEEWPLSHAPLVWMVHEAEKAGLKFDWEKLVALNCCPDKIDDYGVRDEAQANEYSDALGSSSIRGFLHDCLRFGGGLGAGKVLTWRAMEYLPFRRMDLRPDGTWRSIRWPLPRGETRDVPADVTIHNSVLKRMQKDDKFRPGNLIEMGIGGRGHKTARKEDGIGEWVVVGGEGDRATEVLQSKRWRDEFGGFEPEHGEMREVVKNTRGSGAGDGK